MRQWFFCICLSFFFVVAIAPDVRAECGPGSVYGCTSSGASAAPPTPESPGSGEGGKQQSAPPLGSGEPIFYSQTMTSQNAPDVQPNLIEEKTALGAGQCVKKTLPPLTTDALPFVYDGKETAMKIAAGAAVVRAFVSSMPGYDPLARVAPGLLSDFQSPCHAQANLPQDCKDGKCAAHPLNKNSISLMDVQAATADTSRTYNNCPLVPGQTYYLNVQNNAQTPACVSIGSGADCSGC